MYHAARGTAHERNERSRLHSPGVPVRVKRLHANTRKPCHSSDMPLRTDQHICMHFLHARVNTATMHAVITCRREHHAAVRFMFYNRHTRTAHTEVRFLGP